VLNPNHDPVWWSLREQAAVLAEREPVLSGFVHTSVLNHARFADALSFHLAKKVGGAFLPSLQMHDLLKEAIAGDPMIAEAARADLVAMRERNPACRSHLEAFLFYKGFLALELHRAAHWFWLQKRYALALMLQSRISRLFQVDIHPAARIGKGAMIDHASAVVVGATAVVGDDVSILHAVTLGGTGKQAGERHPKVADGVLLSVGATVLGNIVVGERSRVGAGSVVLHAVPADTSAVGVPARLLPCAGRSVPAKTMDHVG
jgi:serine O-acetyltransferase